MRRTAKNKKVNYVLKSITESSLCLDKSKK